MSLINRFTRKWFRRNQGRPTRVPQHLIKPGLEGLEERAVPTVTFSYDGGASLTGNLSFVSDNVNSSGNPDEFTMVESTGFGEWRFRSDPTPVVYGNTVLVADATTVNVQGTPPPSINYAGFFDSVYLRPNLAANTLFNVDMNANYSGVSGNGIIRTFASATTDKLITINGGTGSFTFAGSLQDNGKKLGLTLNRAGLTQVMTGTNNTFTGATTVSAGTLQVNGSNKFSAVTIGGGTLNGTGTVGTVALSSGNLSPGAATGILNSGNLSFTGGTFNATLASAINYSQSNVGGTVTLGSNTSLTLNPTYTPATGDSFIIINNDGSDAVSGTFKGLAEGAVAATIKGVSYTISYKGGDGNDVVLTANNSVTATTTGVTTSGTPSVFGQSVTFTATVTPASGSAIPTGTVTFTNGATTLGSATLNASGVATFSTNGLAVGGPYTITASYGGDSTFTTSSGTVSQTVNKASTTTTLTGSPNPSVYGQSVTFTATVSAVAPGTGSPSGTVTFYDGATILGSGTLSAGVATFTTSSLSVGSRVITAQYNGNANFNTSTSSVLNETVNKAGTTTTLSSGLNPSTFGQSVTFTATVSVVAPGAGTPGGTVNFFDGATLIGSGAVSGNQATLTTSTLAAGIHGVIAVYAGDSNFNGSTSTTLTQTVNKASTTTLVTSSLNPSLFGNSVTFTATVSTVAPGAGVATGTVNFFRDATLLGSGTLNGSGVASFSTSSLPAGVGSITAVYAGSGNFNGSTSPAISQIVNQAPIITSANNATFQTQIPGNFNFTATGYPTNFNWTTNGTLPAGVTLSSSGVLSGTPAAGTGGQYNFTVTVSNGISPDATQAFTLIVNQPPEFTNVNNAETFYGVPFNFQYTSSGYPTTFTYAVTAGVLPSGLTLTSGGLLSGTVTPGVQGVFQYTVRSSNGISPDAFQNFTLVVKPTGGLYNYNAVTGELSISLADNVSLTMQESGGITSFSLSKAGSNPFFVPATGSAILTGNQTGTISTTSVAGGLTINNDESRTSGTDNDLTFTSGNLNSLKLGIKLDNYSGTGSVNFLKATATKLAGDLSTFTNGSVTIDGDLTAGTAAFVGGPGNPDIQLTGSTTQLNYLSFVTGGALTLGNSSTDNLDVTNGFITLSPTSVGGMISSSNGTISLYRVSLNSDTSIDTSDLGFGAGVNLQGFIQNGYVLVLDTGSYGTSFSNDSVIDAQVLAMTGSIELGTLGSTVTFGNNSSVTSRTNIIELNGSNYTSPSGNFASLIADDVVINLAARVGGSGSYLFSPYTVNENAYLGTAASTILPGLKLSQAEFDTFTTDVNIVQIGRNAYSGTIATGVLNCHNALYLVNNGGGGKVLVNGLLTVTGGQTYGTGFYVNGSGSTTVLAADIITAGTDVLIDDAVMVDGANIGIDTTSLGAIPAGADVTLTGGTRGIFSRGGVNNNLTLDGGTDGIVEIGYLRGLGTSVDGSLVGNLTAKGHGISLYSDNTLNGDLTLNSSYVTLYGNVQSWTGSITLLGETSLQNDVNLTAGKSILLNSTVNGSGKNLSLGGLTSVVASGTIQGVNTLTLTNSGNSAVFQDVSAQNLAILGTSAGSSSVDFLGDVNVPGYFSTAAGAYAVSLLGSTNNIGGPLTTANDLLVIGNSDTDQTNITNDLNRTLGTKAQGTIDCGGAVSLASVAPTTPGGILNVYGQTIDIGFDTSVGSQFTSVDLGAVGDVNLNDGMLMVTNNLSITGGSISQTYYSATKVGGLTYLYSYGDINLTAVNDLSLLEVYGNNVTLYTENGVEFDGALISGNLALYTDNLKGATGNITQSLKSVQVYGNANFYSLGDIVLNNPLNVFTGNVTFSGVNVFLGGKSDINLGGGIASGDLTVNTSSANGDITQSGPLNVAGLTTLNAGTGDVILTNTLNSFGTGPVSVAANGANLAATGAIDLGTSKVQVSMDVFATGPVTQSGALNVGNWLDIRSYDAVTLTNAGNTVGTLAIEADSASYVEGGALTLGRINIQQGNFTLTVGGDLTQSGPVQVVSPGAVTTINASGFDVILPDLRNDLVEAVITANNVVLADQNNVTLRNSTVAGDLEVYADATVTLLDVIADGAATINAGQDIYGGGSTFGSGTGDIHSFDAGRYIDFTNFGNPSQFNGSTYFNGTIVDVTATGDLVLAAGNASILMSLVTDGSISQDKAQGYLNVSGNMILEAGGDITLDTPGNVIVGNIASSAKNITLLNTSQILLDTTTATGDLTLIAPAGVDQINPVTVGGKLDIQAAGDTVTLTHAQNSLPTIALVADSADIVSQGAVNLLPSTVGNLKLRAGGAITQSGGALTVDELDLSAFGLTGPAAITLGDATNRLRMVSLMGGNTVIQDTGYLALGLVHTNDLTITIQGDLYQTNMLSVSGNLSITAEDVDLSSTGNVISGQINLDANSAVILNQSDILLGGVDVTEGLKLNTPGQITQNLMVNSVKAGAYDLYAANGATLSSLGGGAGANRWEGGKLTLTGVNALSGGLTSHGSGVKVEGAVGGTMTILSGTLEGNGKIGRIDNVKGTVIPTLAIPVSSTLTGGSVLLEAGSALNIQLNSVAAGQYSQLVATQTILGGESAVTLQGAQLNLNAGAQFSGLLGNQVTIIDNQGDNAVSGTFNDLPEGAGLRINGQEWVISYKGGTGNDVVLTRQRYVPPATGPVVATPFSLGSGSLVASLGNGKVGIWSDNGQYQEITPFPGYTGPLNVNTLTRSGNTVPDSIVVAVAGPSVPHVLVVDALSGRVALSFYAFDPKFLGGVTVAGGVTKLNGDQTTVILCGAGAGSAPAVSVFDAVDGMSKGAFYAFSEQYKGGVRVALSSPLSDGTSYVVVGSTINSHVVSFLLDDYNNAVSSFYAFPPANCPDGLYVSAADLDQNGSIEIITGAAKGKASPQVAVFSLMGQMKKAFNAFDMSFAGGVRVSVNDMDGDGDLDIMAASGPGAQGTLNAFNYQNLELIDSMFISDSINGVVAGNNFVTGAD